MPLKGEVQVAKLRGPLDLQVDLHLEAQLQATLLSQNGLGTINPNDTIIRKAMEVRNGGQFPILHWKQNGHGALSTKNIGASRVMGLPNGLRRDSSCS